MGLIGGLRNGGAAGSRANLRKNTSRSRSGTRTGTRKRPGTGSAGRTGRGGGRPGTAGLRERVTGWREAARTSAARRQRRERAAQRARERDIAAGRRPPLNGLLRAVVMLLAFGCMVVFAALLAKVTLVPSPASVTMVHANFHPGASIRAYFDQPDWKITAKEVGGNVLLGLPFGLLLPVLFPRTRGLLRVVVTTAFVMLCVETVQGTMVEGRAFDIDDVILNTAGALLGYLLIGWKLGRSVHPRRAHWWQRRTPASS